MSHVAGNEEHGRDKLVTATKNAYIDSLSARGTLRIPARTDPVDDAPELLTPWPAPPVEGHRYRTACRTIVQDDPSVSRGTKSTDS